MSTSGIPDGDLAAIIASLTAQRQAVCCGARHPDRQGQPLALGCQLCPTSPTYWRNQPASGPTTVAPAKPAPLAEPTSGLDWSRHKTGAPAPCRICGGAALLRDQHGQPCHKACAEQAGEGQAALEEPNLIQEGRAA